MDEDWNYRFWDLDHIFTEEELKKNYWKSKASIESEFANKDKQDDYDKRKNVSINNWKADWSPTQDKFVRLVSSMIPKTTAWKVTSLVSPQVYAVAKWLFPSF